MTDAIVLAWAAGFFDGEGCTGAALRYQRNGNGRTARTLYCELSQVDEQRLRRFADAVGVGRVRLRQRSNRRPIWQWRASGGRAAAALRLLWPYLSDDKRTQAQRALHNVQRDSALRRGVGPRPGRVLGRLRALARRRPLAL